MSKMIPWESSITEVRKDTLSTYGVDQEDIIRSYSYEEMAYLLLFGKKPSKIEAMMLRAVILSHCSHGITGQSTLAVRMAVDCGLTFLNAALGGFLVGSGRFHQGSLEVTMRELQMAHQSTNVQNYVQERIGRKERISGYGHRFHTYDPRARVLMELCDTHSFVGPYVVIARQIDSLLQKSKGIRMNIEAAGGSILLDLGFPPEVAPLIILVGRGPMFAAAYMERLAMGSKPFQPIKVFDVVAEERRKK